MKLLAHLFLAVAIGLVTGLLSAFLAVEHGRLFGTIEIGSWRAWPFAGSASADPYSRAMIARTGQVPIGAAEGLSFTAENDAEGGRLSTACDYVVSGSMPPSRLWTLSAVTPGGALMRNTSGRTYVSSRAVLRGPDGTVAIRVSARVQPGNWLPVGDTPAPFNLIFRFYDMNLSTEARIEDLPMPSVRREVCR